MLDSDPLWYKDAVIYQLHVRAFHDSVDDGIGDFRGLTSKLGYLQDLGITTVWILPFYPSPLKDDGYDIADYTNIHPHYGKLADFREFLNAAHAHGLRVVTELVINHTSDQHWWFQRARRAAPGTRERDFYVWSDTPEKYQEARIIFKDFEQSNWAWDPVAKAYYWHRFYSHQPDLNYDNPAVWNAIMPLLDFWMNMGVDGMRLDAVPYLFEREGTSCENLPETHEFLKALRRHVDERFPQRMLLAEANQWPEDAVAYFGQGDECHMAFHFPVMPRLFMAIHMEDRFPILDILAQTPAIPDNCQWCMFLRNHDELTLEMVTDEERDYMYRAYAEEMRARINLGIRRRLAPLLGNNRRRIELMNGLLFSLPGTPVIYYGDEIGMGDNIYLGDRNGVRTPMQWSADRNGGFSRANPQKLFLPVIIDPEYHHEAVNVEAQQNNSNSLLWWMKRLIALRKRYKAFGRGTLEFLHPSNRRVLAFVRRYQEECILVVANLSRFMQYVELDLSAWAGWTPIELFGRNPLPRAGKQPYPLTLGPHAFYWFELEMPRVATHVDGASMAVPLPTLVAAGGWEGLFSGLGQRRLEEKLPAYLQRCRWACGPARRVKGARVRDVFRFMFHGRAAYICLLQMEFDEGEPRLGLLPLTMSQGDELEQVRQRDPGALVAQLPGEQESLLVDALYIADFCRDFLRTLVSGGNLDAGENEAFVTVFTPYEAVRENMEASLAAGLTWEEQTHTSVVFGDKLILKVFRRVEEGVHPEIEVGRFLTERAGFAHAAPVLGVVEFQTARGELMTLVALHGYLANEGTAWQQALDELSRFFEGVLALPAGHIPQPPASLREGAGQAPPAGMQELMGHHLDLARLLGQRTAEMHLALASTADDPAFAPEPYTPLYQRSIYQSMRNGLRLALEGLRDRIDALSPDVQPAARRVLAAADVLHERFRAVMKNRLTGRRMRIHGDYNLSEILSTGKDYVVIDFEGHPSRSLAERRLKRSPLRDVASMVRSYQYAALSALQTGQTGGNGRGHPQGVIRTEDIATLRPWAEAWYGWAASAFVQAYLDHAKGAEFLPATREEFWFQLDVFQLEKALQELAFELDHRLGWAPIPLFGILHLLGLEWQL